jgi:hypothetical protein
MCHRCAAERDACFPCRIGAAARYFTSADKRAQSNVDTGGQWEMLHRLHSTALSNSDKSGDSL